MRIYGWLIIGFLVCHESLTFFGQPSNGESPLFSFIYNPILIVQGALLLLVGLFLCVFSLRYALVMTHHEIAHPYTKIFCVMIYTVTLLLGWSWLLWTLLWGGILIIILSLFLFVLWD